MHLELCQLITHRLGVSEASVTGIGVLVSRHSHPDKAPQLGRLNKRSVLCALSGGWESKTKASPRSLPSEGDGKSVPRRSAARPWCPGLVGLPLSSTDLAPGSCIFSSAPSKKQEGACTSVPLIHMQAPCKRVLCSNSLFG